jgi:hypothetical protein
MNQRVSFIILAVIIGWVTLAPAPASATSLSGGGSVGDSSWAISGGGNSIVFYDSGGQAASVSLSGQMGVSGTVNNIDQNGSYQLVGSGNQLKIYRDDGNSNIYEGSLSVNGGTVSGSTGWIDSDHFGGSWFVQGSGNNLQLRHENGGWSGVSFNDASGSISASPNPCILSNGLCTSTISWSSQNAPSVTILVRSTGQIFNGGAANGSSGASWITGTGYWFDLHETSSASSPTLASVFVKGVGKPTVIINGY